MKPLAAWLKISLICLVISGFWWRVQTYNDRILSCDEINQYNHGLGALKPFWTLLFYCEAHSFPGDYLLTYPFIQIFKITDKWGLAIPHALTALLGFYVLWLLCRRYFKNPASWLVTFSIFSFHRELIYHALEMRPYSLLTAMGLGTFYILDSLISPGLSPSRLQCVLWWVVLILTILYHPYGMFMVACVGLFLLLRDWRKTSLMTFVRRRWVFFASFLIVALPLWLYYIHGNPKNAPEEIKANHIDVFEYIPNPLVNPFQFFKSVVGNLVGSKLAWLLSLGVMIRLFWPSKDRLEIWGFVAVVIVLPIMLLLLSDSTFEYWFIQRQYVWVMALYSFFTGLCWDGLINAWKLQRNKK